VVEVHPDQRGLLQEQGLEPSRGGAPIADAVAPPSRKPVPDVVGPGLSVLFAGINPSLRSAEVGHHFARPGNRFWPAIHLAGFTPRRLRPDEDAELPRFGVGVTNLADRPTRAATELTDDELRTGAVALDELVRRWSPRLVAVLGIAAWRTAFGRPRAGLGLQDETLGARPVWVLPNPSGLNAHHQLPDLARLYGEARDYALALRS
jgi:TDG/mug DNA glycosylase family protein